ncbi:MAG: AmmeMemoRadiSam system protein A [Caldisericales bacterium]|nr:AmmeMemoRadiSam system protein A [Caldisericales bacterium]
MPDEFVELATKAIRTWVLEKRIIDTPAPVPESMRGRAGVFVSIHEDGDLRGCIGTFLPTTANIAREIIEMAIEACSGDPRFSPVRPNELDGLEINVDVLDLPEPIDSIAQLDPKTYGVIVSRGARRGLLLPDLEGIDTAEQQVAIARRKAGIYDDGPVQLQRFRVTRHT